VSKRGYSSLHSPASPYRRKTGQHLNRDRLIEKVTDRASVLEHNDLDAEAAALQSVRQVARNALDSSRTKMVEQDGDKRTVHRGSLNNAEFAL
jgi:hypothetical protein